MTTASEKARLAERLPAPEWALALEGSLRQHPASVAIVCVAMLGVVTLLRMTTEAGVALAFSSFLPVALCAYAVGLVAGIAMAVGAAALWLVSTLDFHNSLSDASVAFLIRLLANLGVVVLAAAAGAASQAREKYLAQHEQLDRLRRDLVAAFSHDLRSPLLTIVGWAEILRDDVEAQAHTDPKAGLDVILAEAYRLDKLIGDMLGATAAEDSPELNVTTFQAEDLIAELRAELDHLRRHGNVTLMWDVQPELPPLQTDRAKVTSIVRNLTNNALKFTKQGHVGVKIAYEEDRDSYRLEVEDTGIGIAPEALPHLFNRFYRTERTRHIDGFGLGLFIVKRFTEMLGGSVAVRSSLEKGSVFTVILPRCLQPASTSAATPG